MHIREMCHSFASLSNDAETGVKNHSLSLYVPFVPHSKINSEIVNKEKSLPHTVLGIQWLVIHLQMKFFMMKIRRENFLGQEMTQGNQFHLPITYLC